jgi:hypothetical protein
VAYDAEDRIEVIVDWKSSVDIDAARLNSMYGCPHSRKMFSSGMIV